MRSVSLTEAFGVLTALGHGQGRIIAEDGALLLLALAAATPLVPKRWVQGTIDAGAWLPAPVLAAITVTVLALCSALSHHRAAFVYFQF